MSTQSQIAANQANAQQSTGPRSVEGKSIASQNSTKHGLTGKFVLIAGEDPDEYQTYMEEYFAQHNPATMDEQFLVRQMADAMWRLRRVQRLEAPLFNNAPIGSPFADPDFSSELLKLNRYEKSLESSYFRASRELRIIRKEQTDAVKKGRKSRKSPRSKQRRSKKLPNSAPPSMKSCTARSQNGRIPAKSARMAVKRNEANPKEKNHETNSLPPPGPKLTLPIQRCRCQKRRQKKQWFAQIYIRGRGTHIGMFETEEQAAWAYDKAALEHLGAEAYLNFRDGGKAIEICPEENIARIRTLRGEVFIVDMEDAERVSEHYWTVTGLVIKSLIDGRKTTLHEFLLGKTKPNVFAHLNGDRHDYRRSNLSIVPVLLHCGRHRKIAVSSSRFKGVNKKGGKWQAGICSKGKQYYLGMFSAEEEAARDTTRPPAGSTAASPPSTSQRREK